MGQKGFTKMEKLFRRIVKLKKFNIIIFLLLTAVCALIRPLISVNYDMNDYLPSDSESTIAIDIMGEEFSGAIPNARIIISGVSIAEALDYKEKLKNIEGVTDVTWLDDAVNIMEPLETQDIKTVENYYKENNALFSVAIEKEYRQEAVSEIRQLIGDENAMTGSAVFTAAATENTVSEIMKVSIAAVLFVLLMLLLTTESYIEPLFVLVSIGISILINMGSNIIFGEVSFVTNAAGSILQLAVSLDYAVFLIHRFNEYHKKISDPEEAMVKALNKSLSSILSSGLTTVIGFLALCLMRFQIGPDLGLALAKGIAISLITVFVLLPSIIVVFYKLLDKTNHRPFLPSYKKFGNVICKAMIPLVLVVLIIVVPSYLASVNNEYYYGASHIFNEQTQVGSDTIKIEEMFGQKDTYVVLVPKGDFATERLLADELKRLPQVTGIIAYVEQAGAEIPMEYLDTEILSKLVSENYSRMVLSIDAEFEGDNTFALVEEIRNIANSFYPNSYYLAGEAVSTYDLMNTVTADMVSVNFIAIGAVFLVLVFAFKSISLPFILVLCIETAVWINLAIPYFCDNPVFYIAYLIISSVQLGATVDYAILFTDRYNEFRQSMGRKNAVRETVSAVTASIITSGMTLTVVGLLLGAFSTHGLLSQLGYFVGIGAICSLILVMFILPGLLYVADPLIQKTTKGLKFHNKKGDIEL